MNYITRRTKKETVAVPLTNFLFSLKHFIGGLFGLHFNRTAFEYSAVPAIYLRKKCTHIIWFPLVRQPILSHSVLLTCPSCSKKLCVWRSFNKTRNFDIPEVLNCTHKDRMMLKRKRVLMWRDDFSKLFVARYRPTHIQCWHIIQYT